MFRASGAAEMLSDPIVIDSIYVCYFIRHGLLADDKKLCLIIIMFQVIMRHPTSDICNACFHFGTCVLAVFKLEWHIYLHVICIHVDVALVIICNFEER